MFRTDKQMHQCFMALLGQAGLRNLWTPTGPSDRACNVIDGKEGLSTGEEALVAVCFAFYNGVGKFSLSRLGTLDNENLEAVGSMLVAIAQGPEAIDRWLSGPAFRAQGRLGPTAVLEEVKRS